ncbi:ArnT family glycosyltransferase [Fuscibacter oryzae]|uniref:Glycosyltransferase family 39 protein n=1 Tax=Fuscibacter oryzae TaxID=2803939 RepID=A0A8J7MU10_9RHOB|nr:glycosyltransferase family 39 protein [Fuscibacter oryzae]MBL4928403.1 glycosyltransferase family 39 protein [Fuscibacter oryzae]
MNLSETGWLRPALGLVLAVALLRWTLLALNRTDLFVDEAQYWLWGQHFAFGYYSKPPLIAWVIGAVTGLVGSDAPFWVRMPGAAFHGATALLLGALAARGGRALALWTVAAYLTLPMVAFGSLILSTDTIMAPFFAAALLFHARLIERGRTTDAVLAGVMVGVACLAKYAGVYFLIGVALAAILRRDLRIGWRNAGLMVLAWAVTLSPNLIWNLTHGLSTFSHTADNIGWVKEDSAGPGLNPASMAEFVVSQFGVMGPVLFGALVTGLWRFRQNAQLAAFALPALAVVSVQALLDKAYANWAVSAYFAGTVLAMTLLANRPRLRLGGVAINTSLALALPLLTVFPEVRLGGDRPFLFRYLGRADLSQQIIALAQQPGNLPVVSTDRDVLADLFYTGRASGLAFYAPRPQGKPQSHYEQSYPLPADLPGQVLVITGRPMPCLGAPMPLKADGGAFARRNLAAYVADAACAGQL